jgi:hypothetical protein
VQEIKSDKGGSFAQIQELMEEDQEKAPKNKTGKKNGLELIIMQIY